jgi:NAD(P)-dependent dehydrogenase (short-subunit alcohol dehydrogenase family)/broad specificity phosphatase PhoE
MPLYYDCPRMTRFLLIRHGEPQWELARERDLAGPLSDFVPLDASGIAQSEQAGHDPRLREATLLLCSPYTRALHTAAIICRTLSLPIIVEYDLRERQPATGHVFYSVEETLELCREYERFGGEHPPGAPRPWEERTRVHDRVMAVLRRYVSHACVVVVCHEKVIESLLQGERTPCGGIREYRLSRAAPIHVTAASSSVKGDAMGRLEGKIALVTGAGSGIGLAIARCFHQEGASVVLCGRRVERLAGGAREISPGGERITVAAADLTVEEELSRVAELAGRQARRLDILVNCAGIMRFAGLADTGVDDMLRMFKINTFAPWRMSVALLPLFRAAGGGSIVNVASISGSRPFAGSGAYCMSKAALIMMSQVMALELARDRIRVNCISPGMVEDTELGDSLFTPEQVRFSYDRFRPLHPLGRNGRPIDVAQAALFFACEESAWITGGVLPLDGGRHLTTNAPG